MTLLQTAKNIRCSICALKLCKFKEYEGALYIEIKHKRKPRVLAKEVIIQCIDCGTKYRVSADTQTIEEIS